jgi:hypothetical protein
MTLRTAIAAALLMSCVARAVPAQPNAALHWNTAILQGIRDSKLGAPIVARGLAIVHTCMYDAWAAYDEHAVGTQLAGALRRPASERNKANKEQAISYAAYRALADVFPGDKDSVYIPLMKRLGYDPNDNSTDIDTPTGIGNVACAAVLEFRHHDKSNQLGDLAQGPYSDWTGYVPANYPSPVPVRTAPANPNHWQPLAYVNSTGDLITQHFMGAQWGQVTPFALSSGDQFRERLRQFGPATYGSREYEVQAEELVAVSAGLTDRQKMIAEYWLDGPNSEQPAGHWALFAQGVSARDHHTLDDDVKMFFVLSNAVFDAGIAAWDAKRTFDSVRPVTAISFLFHSRKIRAWGGPGKGTVEMDGSQWIPYQPLTFPTFAKISTHLPAPMPCRPASVRWRWRRATPSANARPVCVLSPTALQLRCGLSPPTMYPGQTPNPKPIETSVPYSSPDNDAPLAARPEECPWSLAKYWAGLRSILLSLSPPRSPSETPLFPPASRTESPQKRKCLSDDLPSHPAPARVPCNRPSPSRRPIPFRLLPSARPGRSWPAVLSASPNQSPESSPCVLADE